MRKRYVASAIGAISASAVVGYVLSDKNNRDKLKQMVEGITSNIKKDSTPTLHTILEDAGIPDQVGNGDLANMENAKMVSEGSQYGVSYYNEVRSENEDNTQGNLQ